MTRWFVSGEVGGSKRRNESADLLFPLSVASEKFVCGEGNESCGRARIWNTWFFLDISPCGPYT
jgi:hypothetical protein